MREKKILTERERKTTEIDIERDWVKEQDTQKERGGCIMEKSLI